MNSIFRGWRGALNPAVVRASVGAMLVFYNVTVISYSLPFVGQALFQSPDRIQGALNTLGLVVAGYLAKPFAQALAGRYADRHGRKPVLAAASLAAAISSLFLAVLPTTAVIGVGAPILFFLFTAFQAAAAGAEWPLLAAYVAESTPAERRAYTTSFASFNVVLGWALAIIVPLVLVAALDQDDYADWGWRVALLPGVLLGILSFALRRRLPETPTFLAIQQAGGVSRSPLSELFQRQMRTWLAVMLHVGMISAAFFLTVAYPVVFVVLADKFSQREALVVGLVGLGVLVVGIQPAGALADRIGPRPVSATGFLLFAAFALPSYALTSSGTLALALLGAVLLGAPLALAAGVYEAWIVSSFRTRYTGVAATSNGVGIALFGTPAIWAASQLARDHGYLAPAALLVAAGLVGAASTRWLSTSVHEPLG